MAAKYPESYVYDNRIFVQGIGPETSEEDLTCYLKQFTGQNPIGVKFSSSEEGACIVTFPRYVDVSRLRSKSPTLHNYQLHIEEVPVSNTLRITGLSHKLRQEKLEDYLKKISGGSTISRIDFRKEEKTALITFTDCIDIEEICKRSHKVDGIKIHVEIYYEQLFDENGSESVVEFDGFTDEQYQFLQNSNITQYVKQKMKKSGLTGHWEKHNGRIKTYADNDQHAVDIAHILKQSIVEWRKEFDEDSMGLMTSENWEERKQRYKKAASNTVDIQVDTDMQVLTVYSTDKDAGIVKEMIQNDLTESTVTSIPMQGHSLKGVLKYQPYEVHVMVGDITGLKVDAIINATNKDLKHIGGLAKALVDKGGNKIQDECDWHVRKNGELDTGDVFCSSAGRLKCQKLFHVFISVWQDGKHNEEEILREAIMKSLEKVCKYKFKSVALPALGAGVYGMPLEASARIVVEAVKDFFTERNNTESQTSLSRVYLCDIQSEIARHFINSLKHFYGEKAVDEREQVDDGQKDDEDGSNWKPPESQNQNSERLPSYHISLLQQSGYIEDLKAKYRSVTIKIGSYWISFDGPSSAIASAKKHLHKYLKSVKTKSGKISDEKQRCLQDAGVKKYLQKNLQSKDVQCFSWQAKQNYLTVYAIDDQNLAKAFSIIRQEVDEFSMEVTKENKDFIRSPQWKTHVSRIQDHVQVYIDIKLTTHSLRVVTMRNNASVVKELINQVLMEQTKHTGHGPTLQEVERHTLSKFTIVLMEGDITDLNVKAIVNSANKTLKSETGIRRAIADKAGPSVKRQLNNWVQQNGELEEGELCCSEGGDLQCEIIIHAVFPSWQGGTFQEKESLNETVQRCLETANSKTCSSIAFPVVGTGTCCINDKVAVSSILEAIETFYINTARPYVTEVFLCCKLNDHVDLYKKKIPEYFKTLRTKQTPGQSSKNGNEKWENTPVRKTPTLKDGFLELLNKPKAAQYLNEKISAEVKGRFEIQITNHLVIFAENDRFASSIEKLLLDAIEFKSIATKEPKKWEEKIKTFSIEHAGKFHAVFQNAAIDCYGTRDVMYSEEFKKLSTTISKSDRCCVM